MKKLNKYLGMTAVAVAAVSLASCQNQLDDYMSGGNTSNGGGVSLVKAPDVVAWSGSTTLGNTGAVTRGNQDAPFYNGSENVKPADITPEELEAVVKYFHEHQGKSDEVKKDFKNFYVQQVSYEGTFYAVDGNNQYTAQQCVNQINTGNNTGDNVFGGNDDFNKCRYIYNSSSLDFWYNNAACSYWSNNFKMVYIPGYGYYVGFDVEGQPDGQWDANKNMHLTGTPDGWYYDRIIKIVPADSNGNIIPLDGDNGTGEGEPEDGETPGGGTQPENPGSGEENENPGSGNNGNTASTNRHGNEVEVNYAILDSHDKYGLADLVTKLSIHVRTATDVDIKIPIPNKYVVESDDLYIFQNHYNGVPSDKNTLLNEDTSLSYEIYDSKREMVGKVILYIKFEPDNSSLGADFSNGYIHVYTQGITKEVIDACWDNNQDGINFEIYNYFQTEDVAWEENDTSTTVEEVGKKNRELLYACMNKAVISFTTQQPNYYINAFGYNQEMTDVHPWHATVVPATDQGYDLRYGWEDLENVPHLNGTPFNNIWVHQSVTLADNAHRH